ncbi:DUF2491 family protein [Acetobacter malorum]|nr:DUF2491 family protein [Acetobacter malorum]
MLCAGVASLSTVVLNDDAHARASSSGSHSSSSSFSSSRSSRVFTPTISKPSPSRTIQKMNEAASAQAFRAMSRSNGAKIAAGAAMGGGLAAASSSEASAHSSAPPSPPKHYDDAPIPAPAPAMEATSGGTHGDSGASSVPERRDRVVVVHDHNDNSSSYFSGMAAGAMMESASHPRPDYPYYHDDAPRSPAPAPAPAPAQQPAVPVLNHQSSSIQAPPPPTLQSQSESSSGDQEDEAQRHHWGLFLLLFLAICILAWMFIRAIKRKSGVSSVTGAIRNKLSEENGNSAPEGPKAPIPSLPTILIGAGITIPAMATSSDPASDQPEMDFEPDVVGQTSITAIGVFSGSEDMAALYTNHDQSDHVRISFDPQTKGQIVDAMFFTVVSPQYTNTAPEWDAWLNHDDGLMGQPDIEHGDKKWTRSILPQDERRLEPVEEREHIETMLSTGEKSFVTWTHRYTLYERNTGYSDGYPAIEYMMIRASSRHDGEGGGEDIMFLQILGGVPLSVASLNLP